MFCKLICTKRIEYKGEIVLSKKKIIEMVLLTASVVLAAIKSIVEQEEAQEDNDKIS